MFAVGRIIRCKFNLKNYLYTSSTIRCDQNEDGISKANNRKKVKKSKKDEKASTNKEKLTAEVNPQDYKNFKSQKSSKVELYTDNTSPAEKLNAKTELQSFIKEVESEAKIATPINDKLNSLAVAKPKEKVKKIKKDELTESAKAVALNLGGDTKKTEDDILGYLKEIMTEERNFKENKEYANDDGRSQSGQYNRNERFRENRWAKGKESDSEFIGEDLEQSSEGNVDGGRWRNVGEEPRLKDYFLQAKLEKKQYKMKGLGLFNKDMKDSGPKLKIWDQLEELELNAAATIPPKNYFEELIQWTKEGKLWHFPIDNDQGCEAEANVDFTEHVFLEEHLEPWCPKSGPLRHFMELVLTGLSKNHYLSVEEKKEHINWYKEYFEGKKKLLMEMGALDNVKVLHESGESKDEQPS